MSKKLFGLMARREDLSPQAFHDHYRHPHGTLGLGISSLRDYVQSHQIHTDVLGAEQTRYEAIAELWFDNEQDIVDFRKEPMMVGFLNEDEWRFVDMKRSAHFIGSEEVISSGAELSESSDPAERAFRLHNRPISVKLLQFFPATLGANWYLEDERNVGRRLGAVRHVLCHPTTPTVMGRAESSRPPSFAGVRELWWPTKTAFERAVAENPDAWALLTSVPEMHTVLAQAERYR